MVDGRMVPGVRKAAFTSWRLLSARVVSWRGRCSRRLLKREPLRWQRGGRQSAGALLAMSATAELSGAGGGMSGGRVTLSRSGVECVIQRSRRVDLRVDAEREVVAGSNEAGRGRNSAVAPRASMPSWLFHEVHVA